VDLDSIVFLMNSTQIQPGTVGDFFHSLISLLNFISSYAVVKYLISESLYDRAAKNLINVYSVVSFLRRRGSIHISRSFSPLAAPPL
jgi:hypothetical protein